VVKDVLSEGQQVKVKVLAVDERGKVRLSMRLVDQETGEEIPDTRPPREGGDERGPRSDRGPRRDGGGRDDRGPRRDGGDRGPRRDGPRDDRGPRPERAPREEVAQEGGSLPDFLTGPRD
jgi:polyribonucleotide nucleotidyltransferase